jgi:hypothetical protein
LCASGTHAWSLRESPSACVHLTTPSAPTQLANTHASTLHNHSCMLVLHCATQAEKARLQEVATGLGVTVQHCMQRAADLEGQASESAALVASLTSRADDLQSQMDYTSSHHNEVSPAGCVRANKPLLCLKPPGPLPFVSVIGGTRHSFCATSSIPHSRVLHVCCHTGQG